MNRQKIARQLTKLGLKKGSIVLLHSSLGSIGKVDGGADAVVDAFLDAIGPKGTLLVPVFGALGIITDTVKKRPNALISPCPLGTLAGIGPAASELFADHWKPDSPHAQETPFCRLMEKNGIICLLGVDQDRNTALHGVEAMLKLPYLGTATETFRAPNGKSITKTWKYYPGPHRNFIGLDRIFIEEGAMKTGQIGNAQLRIIDAKKMWELALAGGQADPAFVLCDNPNCPDCVRQRADIFVDRIAREESFKLSISSRLAGRYVPEMIENLLRCGLKFVELDYIQGVAASNMNKKALKTTVAEFTAAGIKISAMRLAAAPDAPEKVAENAKFAGICTLLLPASAAAECVKKLKDSGFTVLFYNRSMTASATVVASKTNDVGICFNPANFAECGQAPFSAYHANRFINYMAQLDVNDGTRDGISTRLACGRAEIKEIISILRCRNFDGVLTIGGGSLYPTTPQEAVADFTALLDNM